MKYKAHDYQQYATEFIIGHPVSCLILDMGLGKTVITLTDCGFCCLTILK